MSSTRVNYKNKGFWIAPHYIELLCKYICDTFESIGLGTFNTALTDIYEDCDSNRTGESIGMVKILFDEYITNSTDKNVLISVFNQTKTKILALGSTISTTDLNNFENTKTLEQSKFLWTIAVQTSSLVATLNLMIELLNETYPFTSTSIQWVGFPANSPECTFI